MHFANPKAFTRPLRKLLKTYLLSVTAGDIMLGEVADHLCVNDLDRGLSDKERIRAAADTLPSSARGGPWPLRRPRSWKNGSPTW